MKWIVIGLAAAVWLWGQVPPKMNMRWRASMAAAEPGNRAGSSPGPGNPSTTRSPASGE